MGIDEYLKARKLGLRAYHDALQAHKPPYLPVLDEIVNVKPLARVSLGVMQVPLERIVGTATRARSNAFAVNFMPILEPNSEFAQKWSRLLDGIVEDGMRQPATMLEYLNKYYLVEGNKRISVMKYLDALFVEAEVTRVIPRRSDTPEKRIYFEYLSFFDDSGINDIYFSEEGSFGKLCALTGHTPGEKWTSEERMDLRSSFMYFANEYSAIYEGKPPIDKADAFLMYLSVYGYEDAKTKTSAEIAEDIRRLRDEIERQGQGETVNLILDRTEGRSGSLLGSLFRPSKVKAAFLYHRSPKDSGWNYWHDLGRINAENTLGDKLETTASVAESEDAFEDEIERLIREGNRVIFATSPLMLNACIRPSIEHPDVRILCCSLLASSHKVRSYYLRIYEAKFLIGMIAGLIADDNRIGYIADYPILGAAASINAFAMGARMVNPRAKVYLRWSTKKNFDPENPFGGERIRVISNRDINAPRHSSMEYGLYELGENGVNNLAIPVLDWSKFYQSVIESVLNGSFDDDASGVNALDYWWGMSSDALDVILSSRFDPYARRLIHTVQTGIQSDQMWVFEGEMRSQDGEIKLGPDERLSPAEILLMDYLIDNVVGEIPSVEELNERAQSLVRLQGLNGGRKPDISSISWTFGG